MDGKVLEDDTSEENQVVVTVFLCVSATPTEDGWEERIRK